MAEATARRVYTQADEDAWPVPALEAVGKRNGPGAWLEYLSARATLGTLARSPAAVRGVAIEALARAGRRFDHRHTTSARVFLRQAFGAITEEELEERVLTAWRHFLTITLETERLAIAMDRETMAQRLETHFEFVLSEDAERLLASGVGMIGVTPHLGSWEMFPAGWRPLTRRPVYIVGKPAHNRPLSRLVQLRRERWGVRMLSRHGAMRSVRSILAAGGTFGMLLDQRARRRAAMVPFFGRPAPSDRSGAVLLKRLAAPVQICSCLRAEGDLRFRIEVPKVFWPEELADLTPEEIVEKINAVQERMILADPDQYFWLHDRYRPPSGHARDEAEER